MQSMYKQKALNSCYLRMGPHTDTHTQKWNPMVFHEVFQLEERELETRACTRTCPPRVVFDDPARQDSNPQHDATPSTREEEKRRTPDQKSRSPAPRTRSPNPPSRCQADQTRRVDLRHLEPDRPTLTPHTFSNALAFLVSHYSCGLGCRGKDCRQRLLTPPIGPGFVRKSMSETSHASHWSRGTFHLSGGGVGALVAEETPPMYVVERT